MKYSKVYFSFGGGLGDIIYDYIGGKRNFPLLKPLKEKYPKLSIKILSSSHNPQSIELVRYNPYIESAEEFGWQNNGRELLEKNANGYVWISHTKGLLNNLKPEKPKLYLSKEDESIVNTIDKQGRFIFIHPFAGLKDRIGLNSEEYYALIDKIIDKTGLNVAVIGNSHTRTNVFSKEPFEELFNYERKGLFNLVGRSNSRIAVALAHRAVGFIGAWSCYSCTFWLLRKPSTVIVPPNWRSKLKKRFSKGGRWKHRGDCKVFYPDKDTNLDIMRKEILDRTSELFNVQ